MALQSLGVSVTLQKAVQVIKRRFAPMLGLVVLGYVATFVPTALMVLPYGQSLGPDHPMSSVLSLISATISLFVGAGVQGALQNLALNGLAGRDVGFGKAFGVGLRRMAPLAGINLILFVSLFVAFGFLVAPALFLLSMWFVTVPVQVAEKTGVFESFSRSRTLTLGNRWRILAIFGVLLAGSLVLLLIFSILLGLLGPVGVFIMGLIFYVVLPMVFAAVGAATYRELRRFGGEDEQIAEVFA